MNKFIQDGLNIDSIASQNVEAWSQHGEQQQQDTSTNFNTEMDDSVLNSAERVTNEMRYKGSEPLQDSEVDSILDLVIQEKGKSVKDLKPELLDRLGGADYIPTIVAKKVFSKVSNPDEARNLIDNTLRGLGYDTEEVKENVDVSSRFVDGLTTTLDEVVHGFNKSIGGKSRVYEDNAKRSRYELETTNEFYKIYNTDKSLLDTRENTPAFNIAGGLGEATPAIAAGAAVPFSKIGLVADVAIQSALMGAQREGSYKYKDDVSAHSRDIALNMTANLLTAGVANRLKAFKNSPIKYNYPVELKGDLLNAKNVADDLGVDLYDIDFQNLRTLKGELADNTKSLKQLHGSTAEDMNKAVDALKDVENQISKIGGDPHATASKVLNDFDQYESHFKDQARKAYDDFGVLAQDSYVVDEAFKNHVANFSKFESIPRDTMKKLDNYLKDVPDSLTISGMSKEVKMLRSKIRDAERGSTEELMWRIAGENAHNRLLEVSKVSNVGEEAVEVLKQADSYWASFKKLSNKDSFVPKFRKAMETNPARAVQQIRTPKQWDELSRVMSPEGLNMVRSQIIVSKQSDNVGTYAKRVMSLDDELMKHIYGESGWNQIKGLAQVVKYMDTRIKGIGAKAPELAKQMSNALLHGSVGTWYPFKVAYMTARTLLKSSGIKKIKPSAETKDFLINAKKMGINLDVLDKYTPIQ